jgi:hypothetical protein
MVCSAQGCITMLTIGLRSRHEKPNGFLGISPRGRCWVAMVGTIDPPVLSRASSLPKEGRPDGCWSRIGTRAEAGRRTNLLV